MILQFCYTLGEVEKVQVKTLITPSSQPYYMFVYHLFQYNSVLIITLVIDVLYTIYDYKSSEL